MSEDPSCRHRSPRKSRSLPLSTRFPVAGLGRHCTTSGRTSRGGPRARRLLFELMEERWMLSLGTDADPWSGIDIHDFTESLPGPDFQQVIYLSLEGAENVTYEGPVTVSGIDVPPFVAPDHLRGQEQAIVDSLLEALEAAWADGGVVFVTTEPRPGSPYSTIYVGGDDAAFAEYGPLVGLSEQVDLGNRDPNDIAFVFPEVLESSALTATEYGKQLAGYVGHEAGHLLGFRHAHTVYTGGASDVLAEVAFKPNTHIEIAKDVRLDLLDDGRLDIAGQQYEVHPKILEALKKYPGQYYAGAVGPDGFPELVFGQSLIHPLDTGVWLQRLFDMAWAAQADPSWTDTERLQILAFSYGFATHAAGDAFSHALVNEFSEGVFPAVSDAAQNDRQLANAVRHMMVDAYIGDMTPGTDSDTLRTLLPDGDISDDASHTAPCAIPVRFIYEALLKPFPGDPAAEADTGYTTIDVDAALHTFSRSSGDFLADGFKIGQQIFAFGFTAINSSYTVAAVTPTTLTVAEPLGEENAAGDGNEALVTQGSRGPLLDRFYDLRRAVSMAERSAWEAYELAYGTTPRGDLETLLAEVGDSPTAQQAAEINYAYLNDWREELDDGIQNWAQVGLASTQALFIAQARRDIQNEKGSKVGIDVDPSRADKEASVDVMDVLLEHLAGEELDFADVVLQFLEDQNFDGDFGDSFVVDHLLPMYGVPQSIARLQPILQSFGEAIDDNIVGPVRLALNPITDVIDELKEIPKRFVKELIFERWGVDLDQYERLMRLSNKMDLASVTVADRTIPIFKPGDHEKIDGYMGIEGIAHSEMLSPGLHEVPGITFHENATISTSENVEFDKTKFAAYANGVTFGKLLLLTEDPVDGEPVGAGQLSAVMSDLIGGDYDWSRLNMNGHHGGNIFTTTLQKPDEYFPVQVEIGPNGYFLTDSQPWLRTIDGGSWRDDAATTTTILYRVNSPSDGAPTARAAWTACVPAGRDYTVQVSWLASITQKIDDPAIDDATLDYPWLDDRLLEPATNVTYRIYDGLNSTEPIATVTDVNQRDFNRDYFDGDVTFDDLATVCLMTGILRVEMDNAANGDVIAGPVRIVPADGGTPLRVQYTRDPETLAILPGGYSESGPNWVDLNYPAGSGNFPLWESELLRPAFRSLFSDWQNGPLQFPTLGDPASPDPNQFPEGSYEPSATIPNLATPFDQLPSVDTPAGLTYIVSGTQVVDEGDADLTIETIRGNGDATRDSLTLTTTGSVRIVGDVGGAGLLDLTIVAGRIHVEPSVTISTRLTAGSDPEADPSVGPSGTLEFNAPEIVIGQQAAVLAHASGDYTAGDVVLTATESKDLEWTFGIGSAVFQGTAAVATIAISDGARLTGCDIRFETTATTLKSAELAVDIDRMTRRGLRPRSRKPNWSKFPAWQQR
jgi:hypothetical protein